MLHTVPILEQMHQCLSPHITNKSHKKELSNGTKNGQNLLKIKQEIAIFLMEFYLGYHQSINVLIESRDWGMVLGQFQFLGRCFRPDTLFIPYPNSNPKENLGHFQ